MRTVCTVAEFALRHGLWDMVLAQIGSMLAEDEADELVAELSQLPVQSSRASCRLGSFVFRGQTPVAIRLQFAQEEDCLRKTFLHELAHACDHLTSKVSEKNRRSHGASWKRWASSFSIRTRAQGTSNALNRLRRDRMKLVAICLDCGAQFYRLRRLNRQRKYTHQNCGGTLKSV